MILKELELTEIQKGIYFECQIDDSIEYNISGSILLENLNEVYFENALKILIKEQEMLRSNIHIYNDLPKLVINDEIDVNLKRINIVDCSDKESLIKEKIRELVEEPFDLENDPLLRAGLIKIEENKYLFTICVHHLICDGISMDIIKNKLISYYYKLTRNEKIDIEVDNGYSKFMKKENLKLSKGRYDKQKEFWKNKLSDASALEFRKDYINKIYEKNVGAELSFKIENDLFEKIEDISKNNEISTFTFFLSAFYVLMNKYTNSEDIIISSPFSYRLNSDLEETIGNFVYMLPIRCNVEKNNSFLDVMHEVSKEFIEAYKNLGYPNNLIARDSSLISSSGAPSIFDISFVYDIYEETEKGSMSGKVFDQGLVTFPGNMMVILNKTPEGNFIKVQYKKNLFSYESMDLFGKRFLRILNVLSSDINKKIGLISLLLENERELILDKFNNPRKSDYKPKTIIDIFNSKAQKFNDRIALTDGNRSETYGSVNRKANMLARKILRYKEKDNDKIGLELERSIDLVISILAILKAGCAYVPIEPTYPQSRKEFILKDADISVVVTSHNLEYVSEKETVKLYIDDSDIYSGDDSNLNIELDPLSLAYIMYTSGSTGRPKGVMIENHSVVNTLMSLEHKFPMGENDRFLLKTSFAFDVSTTELFGWFMGEGSLFILEPGGEKNPLLILNKIAQQHITHINFVPSMFKIFMEFLDNEENVKKLENLKWIFIGGEAVSSEIVEKFRLLNTSIKLENVYGPTECTIWASNYSFEDYDKNRNIPIGFPLDNICWYIVSENNELQPVGLAGELCLSGAGLARGYLNRKDLTKEKFTPNPFFREGIDDENYRYMYHTGDLARWVLSGTIEFLDRIDFQVKVRGVRLELGEIETVLEKHKDITQAVVVVKKEKNKADNLCAYYVSENEIDTGEIRKFLLNNLPPYMVPSLFVHKTEFPTNVSGKINRNALKDDKEYLKQSVQKAEYSAPVSDNEKVIADIWKMVLNRERVGIDENFFEIGGNSLALIQVYNRLKKSLQIEFPITVLFQLPTIRMIAANIEKESSNTVIKERKDYFKRNDVNIDNDIAIIGMSINVPGADNINEFWDNLVKEKECIHFYKDEELIKLGLPESLINKPNYIKAKGRINDIEYFDPSFFEYTPSDIKMMSPQLRVLYKGIWEALEDAGYLPELTSDRMGIFIGGSDDFEWYKNTLFNDSSYSDKYQEFTLSTNHFLATRLAYKLNITGPVFSALTGCSTTLVTPHLACQSLKLKECDIAVAGGVTIELPNEGGYLYEEGMMFSPDGHCRPFDAKAAGTVFSNGMGLVVLKRLRDAVKDGDNIYAVIKGSAINNDGNQKVGFAAPSINGQADVIQRAYRNAEVDPETVSYVEAHGTGTLLGDPIEVNSLTKAFATDKKQFCTLGSVKGNIGHTDTAAGVVGLIKVALSLKNKYIPGTLNYSEPNPKAEFEKTPFVVKAQGEKWNRDGVFRAGINSFGVGGTNAHMVLEEPPEARKSTKEDKVNLMVFSGKSESAVNNTAKKIMQYILNHKDLNLSDVSWTLESGREAFKYRKAIALNRDSLEDEQNIMDMLEEFEPCRADENSKSVYFMFPGQGSQYNKMARDIYLSNDNNKLVRVFKENMDSIFDLLDNKDEIKEIIYGNDENHKINQTQYSQIAIFATSYCLAKALISIGIKPKALIGHSIGEIVAAAIAGVFSLKDAVEIVKARGFLMQQQKPGIMLSIAESADEIKEYIVEDTWVSLRNSTKNCVVGGTEDGISRFEKIMQDKGIKNTRIKTSHAFHTPMMKEAAEEFKKVLSKYSLKEPRIPIVSNVTGTWIKENEMTDPEYWCRHILNTVNFECDLSEILKDDNGIYIELGSGRTLSTFAINHELKKDNQHFVNLVRHIKEAQNDVEYLNNKIGLLWSYGVEIDWNLINGDSIRNHVSLPTYEFDRKYFPIKLSENKIIRKEDFSTEGEDAEYKIVQTEVKDESEIEKAVIDSYKTVFGYDEISLNDNFYEIGGDSLKAVSLSSNINKILNIKINVGDLFKYKTPKSLSRYITKEIVTFENKTSIKPVAKKEYYEISSPQNRMYTLYLMDKDSVAYNLPSATIIDGKLDNERVKAAIEKLTARHEALRTSFEVRENEPVQIIHEKVDIPLTFSERLIDSDDKIKDILRDFIKPFDLSKAPLFRVNLVKIGEERYVLLFDIHHIVSDATSVEILTKEFNELYFGEINDIPVQYKDYAVWQNDMMKSKDMIKQRDYWKQYLGTDIPVLELATDFERPRVKDFEGGLVRFKLDSEMKEKLTKMSNKFGVTLFMTMLSVWNIVLARYSGQSDIIVGTTVSGRQNEEIKDTIGMFVNMLAMRNKPENSKSFKEFLSEVKENTINAFANQDYQFDKLVEELNPRRELNRNPIFDVTFDYQNMIFNDLEVEGIGFTPYNFETGCIGNDLLLTCQDNKKDNTIECWIEYAKSLFKEETIERMINGIKKVINEVLGNEDILIKDIDMITSDEIKILEDKCNNTYLDIDKSILIQEMFEENVLKHPDKTALVLSDGREFSYNELNMRSNRLAWHLINLGVEKEELIGIMPDRDENLIISMMAVIKSGAAYVPIDPNFPKERTSYILSECNMKYLICPKKYEDKIEFNGIVIDCSEIEEVREENPENRCTRESLANVIFTSGSTGKPKGVMIKQDSIINFIYDIKNRGIFKDEGDRVIAITTISFDIFGFESIVPLCLGNSIYMCNEKEQLDPVTTGEKIVKNKVTVINTPVSRIKAFVLNPYFKDALRQLTAILSGGENFPIQLLKELQKYPNAKIYNMYGPTESTMWSTTKDLTNADSINIGSPIANTQVYVINEGGKIQPIGVFGELCIAGSGLARGYLNNEDETNKKFRYYKNITENKVYRTGDKARILSNGEIELVGRLDSQVKIRGYRIELDEIEKSALLNEKIKHAAVTVCTDKSDNKKIALFYCVREEADDFDESRDVKAWLGNRLPHYMIPTYYIRLDEMPTLPNGKIDRKALKVSNAYESNEAEREKPSTEIEYELLEIWKEVLENDNIGITDNFFDVGGNSLSLILINNKINELLNEPISLMKLFEYPTIESFVASLKNENMDESLLRERNEEFEKDMDIAVIGLSCKMPGAENTSEFWNNIVNGVESITEFTDEDLIKSGVKEDVINNPDYVKAKGYLDGVEYFDCDVFGYTKQEARMMDPQIRLLHEGVWEALEDAGYDSSTYKGRIGLFAGSSSNVPWMTKFIGRQNDLLNAYEAITLNEKDFITTRVSYKMNLKGPSVNVQSACSTSMVAIHEAVESLIKGESDIAVAGGVSVSYPRKEGYMWHEGMIFSKDGHCRPFSDDATGTVSGNGCGLVVLKPVKAALRDGDNIYAVIKGSAINNDGLEKVGYTSPSITGQKDVINQALKKSKLSPENINYVETHGTGTIIGDPIEIEALKQAWRTKKKNYCAIGSVKANIGHLDAASGAAGFIKAVLVLKNRVIPPLINFTKPNSRIDFKNSPFYITTKSIPIDSSEEKLRAAVSSFGIGGTNVHVILEESPKMKESNLIEENNLLIFSGNSREALRNTSEKVLEFLADNKDINISDAAWTLESGRKKLKYRKALTVSKHVTREDIERCRCSSITETDSKRKNIIITLSGTMKDYDQAGCDLYVSVEQNGFVEIYKDNMNKYFSALNDKGYDNFSEKLSEYKSNEISIKDNQLLLLGIEYSSGQSLINMGIEPKAILGEGIGEIAALVLRNEINLETAIDIVTEFYQVIENIKDDSVIGFIVNSKECAQRNNELVNRLRKCRSVEINNTEQNILVINMVHSDIIKSKLTDFKEIDVLDGNNTIPSLYNALGEMWCNGVDINWKIFEGKNKRRKVSLPPYVFDKEVYDSDVILGEAARGENDKKRTGIIKSREDAQNRLNEIWSGILGCEKVRLKDDFFTLGGNSLTAVSLSSEIEKSFNIKLSISQIFNNSTLEKMLNLIVASNEDNLRNNKIEKVNESEYYEVSSAQKRMYAVNELIGDTSAYNLPAIYFMEGKVDKKKLKDVFDTLVKRHEAFRTKFKMVDGEVVQIIDNNIKSVVEFSNIDEKDAENVMNSFVRPFDMSKAPLLRIELASINEEKHILMIDMHHIISDQTSIAILMNEFEKIYKGEELEPLQIQYKDFAKWQNKIFESGEIEKQIDYWMNEYKDEIPVLNLQTDYIRPMTQSYKGDNIKYELSSELNEKIKSLSKELGVTPYMIFMSALNILLWKYTNQKDMVIGTGIAGRKNAELESIVGMFVNTLAIRSRINDDLSIDEYLKYVKEKMTEAYDNSDCQFEMLLDRLNLKKDQSRNPLFDVMINYINMGTEELAIDGLTLKPYYPKEINSKFDITFTVQEKKETYCLELEYCKALFKRESMELLGNRFINMISTILEDTTVKLKDISIITLEERKWINELNNTATDFEGDKTLAQLFEENVRKYGDKEAVIWQDSSISYKKLNAEANKLVEIFAQKGIKHGQKIAILLDRSPLQMISILAILKYGCTYVPIDPESPDSRINFIITDSSADLLITKNKFVSRIEAEIEILFMDNESEIFNDLDYSTIMAEHETEGNCEDIAYIIYTSGSTGKPKGTLVTNKNVIRVIKNTNYITITPEDKILQLSNYAFDGSVFDIFGALTNGAGLAVIEQKKAIEIPQLARFIKENEITIFYITTALFNMLVDWDIESLKNVKKILFGGEAISVNHARKALEILGPGHLIHVYGPTETTVYAAYHSIDKVEDNVPTIPIGNPISNTTLYVLDEKGEMLPANIPGELYIGGAGVCRGYLNREELTKERFISLKMDKDEKVYRTGDKVMRLPNGEIMFMGRMDFQIKIRGFRVELGEIENHIKNIPEVKEAVVIARKDNMGSLYLSAYCACRSGEDAIKPDYIRKCIAQNLPEYMIPSRIKIMDSMPLTTNGKVDRNKLPVIEEERTGNAFYVEPQNETERIILKNMRHVLDNKAIGIKDNFFENGGQSIKAIALVHALTKEGLEVKVNQVLQYPTAEELAKICINGGENKAINENDEFIREKEVITETKTLNMSQIESILETAGYNYLMLSNIVTSSEVINKFPLSPIQKAHSLTGSRLSGFITRVDNVRDEAYLRKVLGNIILKNQLLHSAINYDGELIWSEYDIRNCLGMIESMISHIDLREYDKHTKKLVISGLEKKVLLEAYLKNKLPWRLGIVRLEDNSYMVIWGFDHIAFDGMSAEIIKNQIENEFTSSSKIKDYVAVSKEENQIQVYDDYVKLLKGGPKEIEEDEIMGKFKLDDWSVFNNKLLSGIGNACEGDKKEVNIKIPIKSIDNPLESTLNIVIDLLKEYTDMKNIPLAFVDYGRSYDFKDYYNCIGEFLDIIPILISDKYDEKSIGDLLRTCKTNSVNFISMLYDEQLKNRYKKINNILGKFYKVNNESLSLALFNFQGFVSSEAVNVFRNLEKEETMISDILITSNYDIENLNISIEFKNGINMERMNSAINKFDLDRTEIN